MGLITTRKLLHIGGLTLAAALQMLVGFEAVVAFAAVFLLGVIFVLRRSPNDRLYAMLAGSGTRNADATFVPIFATVVGAAITNLLFSDYAIAGYLVTGWGDAAGEIVGARWGRHRYTISWFGSLRSTKSIEGNLAVLVFSSAGAMCSMLALGDSGQAVYVGLAVGMLAAVAEAVTPCHLDNLTMQVSSSGMVAWLTLVLGR